MKPQIGVYTPLEKIGEGGMGEVYRGLDTMLEREVAIKQLRTEYAGNSDIVERFRTEAVTLAKLNHPHIVTLYSFLREETGLYMVLEFVRGETLDAMIRRRGALPWPEAVALVIQALRALEHAHKMHVIHRDLKPANAILTTAGVLKLMDFGIARILNTARMTRVGHMIGTLEYMAPEQVKGGEGDARSDLYALGIVLYELLAGRVPFEGKTDYDLIKAQVEMAAPPLETFGIVIPAALAQALERTLEKAPDKRFQSAGEFAQALQSVLDQAEDAVRPKVQTNSAGAAQTLQTGDIGVSRKRDGAQSDSLALPRRKLPTTILAFVKENPIITASAVMVLIGLGFLLAAPGDKTAPVSNAEIGRKEEPAAVATPSPAAVVVAPSYTASAPEQPTVNLLPASSRTPGGDRPEPAPVKKPVAPPPREKPPPLPVATRPVVPLPSEKMPPQITEKQPAPSSPAAPPRSGGEESSWQDTPVRR